jgi:hypothetical protein
MQVDGRPFDPVGGEKLPQGSGMLAIDMLKDERAHRLFPERSWPLLQNMWADVMQRARGGGASNVQKRNWSR